MKRKLNLIISKKQIVLAGLTVLLGVAVYVNYLYASSDKATELTEEAASYGEAQLVSGGSAVEGSDVASVGADEVADTSVNADSEAYFAQARLDKQESRDEAKELLQSMYYGGDSTGDELAVIAQDTQTLSSQIECETKVETLLKAQGFEDALCYLSGDSASVIVKTSGLDELQAAKIKSTLLSEISVAAENITIVEIR